VGLESLGDISWDLTILGGCLSVILHGMAWSARRRLRASLKIPLTEEAEAVTHLWEGRAASWHSTGVALSIFSILCAVVWLVSSKVQQ
jgi:hypothetical protein